MSNSRVLIMCITIWYIYATPGAGLGLGRGKEVLRAHDLRNHHSHGWATVSLLLQVPQRVST